MLVVAARDLEDQEFCANTNRYLVADLDGVRKRTSYGMVSRGGPNPVFEEFFTFKVKSAQWLTGTLRVQIWDHNIHLTDDFIGEMAIELRDLEPEPYEPKAQVLAQNAKWFQLRRSTLDDGNVGQLKVAFRLIMNAENVSPEQFKHLAAKATEVTPQHDWNAVPPQTHAHRVSVLSLSGSAPSRSPPTARQRRQRRRCRETENSRSTRWWTATVSWLLLKRRSGTRRYGKERC